MYKMYFNTGVRPDNRLDRNGNVVLMDWQIIKDGVIQIIYFLEKEPESNLTLKWLAGSDYLKFMSKNDVAIRIVDGGMLSEYAIFGRS